MKVQFDKSNYTTVGPEGAAVFSCSVDEGTVPPIVNPCLFKCMYSSLCVFRVCVCVCGWMDGGVWVGVTLGHLAR